MSVKNEKVVQTAGIDMLGDFAPLFAEINDDVLFGKVWNDNAIELKTKAIVTIVSLISTGMINDALKYHLENAKSKGVTK